MQAPTKLLVALSFGMGDLCRARRSPPRRRRRRRRPKRRHPPPSHRSQSPPPEGRLHRSRRKRSKPADASKKAPRPRPPSRKPRPHRLLPCSRCPRRAPCPRRSQHVARYDAAIAAARDRPLSERGRRPHPRRGQGHRQRRACEGQVPARPDHRRRGPQADRLVSLPRRLRHGRRRSAPSWRPIRPGPTAAFSPSAPRRRCSTAPPARARSRHSSPTRRRRRASGLRPSHPRWPPTRTRPPPRRSPSRRGWNSTSRPAQEPAFLKRVGALLTEADHKRRLDRLLLSDSRWAGERNERAAVIRRVIALLSEPEKKKAEARLAVFLRAKNSDQLMSKLPPQALTTEWGLAIQKAQALRRQNKDEEAWKILLAEPEPTLRGQARRLVGGAARQCLRRAQGRQAPRPPTSWCAIPASCPSTPTTMQPSWPAGWRCAISTTPRPALAHFQALAKSADGPLSQARAHYWLGRTYEALGDQAKAQRELPRGLGLQIDTFHGQLARLKLDPQANSLKIAPPAAPTAGGDRPLQRPRCGACRRDRPQGRPRPLPGARLPAAAAPAPQDRGRGRHGGAPGRGAWATRRSAVRIGKSAIARGLNLIYYAYPVHRLPAYTPLRRPPETAFILGIARQESEFNTTTLSGAGARGILQVMPITARHVCRDYKLKCDIARLMKDAAYNTMMGSAYISDRMDEFSGSYVLTLAGYNAGPGRAREWIREFGDPRDSPGRSDRLDPPHPLRGDARLRAEGAVQHPDLPRAPRRGGQRGAPQHRPEADLDGRAEGARGGIGGKVGVRQPQTLHRGFACERMLVVQQPHAAALLRPTSAPSMPATLDPLSSSRRIAVCGLALSDSREPHRCRPGTTSISPPATACGSMHATIPLPARCAGRCCALPGSRATAATSTTWRSPWHVRIEQGATSTPSTAAAAAAPSTTATGRTTPCWSSSTTCSTS